MKKKLFGMLALLLALSMIFAAVTALAAPEGESPEGEQIAAEGESAESEGESAEDAAPAEGESAESEGESAEGAAPAEDAAQAEGESAESEGESAEGAAPAEDAAPAEGDSAEGESAESEGGEAAPAAEPDYSAVQDYEYAVIEAEGDQIRLTYVPSVTTILEVDGLKFKDLNKNGELDVYEDWRADVEDRITDLIGQMTIEEKTGLFYHICSCGSSNGADFSLPQNIWGPDDESLMPEDGHSMYFYIMNLDITHFLDNSNGTPQAQVDYHNAIQSIGERTRLGLPITFSSDRQYNSWGGMIDTPHASFASSTDIELSMKLWEQYAAETRAVGFHVPLHPYGVELGSWNGESPEHIAEMITAELTAIEKYMQSCTKHFISRTGPFEQARSEAQTVDNWMYPWQAAIDCGIQWIMLNADRGLSNEVVTDYDKISLDYLRDVLGFDGITLSDWGTEGSAEGIGYDGTDISTLTIPERYAYAVNAGLDQIGFPNAGYGVTNDGPSPTAPCHREAIAEAYEQGLITEERLEATCRRVLRSKFTLGIFEDPYCDADAALALCASEEYINDPWEITDLDSLNRARNPEVVEMERQLEAESAILFKNDGGILPLEKGINVYVDSTTSAVTLEGYIKELGAYATVVDDIEAADVVIADCSQINDAAELMVEDAQDAGKKIVVVANGSSPNAWMIENADAVLQVNFSRTPDHGTSMAGFILTTEPCVLADLLFGEREPAGILVKEIGRNTAAEGTEWKDLASDLGVDTWVRLILLATMKENEDHSVPSNYDDPLFPYQYGMKYGEEPAFVYDTLVLPKSTTEVTEETSSGTSTSYQTIDGAKAGEPFTVYCLIWNEGADGVAVVEASVDGELAGKNIMAINGGSWRILQMEIEIETAGEHEITVGDITKTITVE